MTPAESAARAGGMPKASRDRSLGTFGNKMKSLSTLVIAVVIGSAALLADEATDSIDKARATSSNSFPEIFRKASEIDDKPGLTIQELESVLGPTDIVEDNSVLLKGIKNVFILSDDRRLHVLLQEDSVSIAGITTKGSDSTILVWK